MLAVTAAARVRYSVRSDGWYAPPGDVGADSRIPTPPQRVPTRPRSTTRASSSAAPGSSGWKGAVCWERPCSFAATEGGDAGLGQIWAYDTVAAELRLVYESRSPADLFGPDNLTTGSWTDRNDRQVDNGNGDRNHLHLVSSDGELLTFAENIADTTEFAGPCFSPDGSTLFVNIYGDNEAGIAGRTLAITGPWASLT